MNSSRHRCWLFELGREIPIHHYYRYRYRWTSGSERKVFASHRWFVGEREQMNPIRQRRSSRKRIHSGSIQSRERVSQGKYRVFRNRRFVSLDSQDQGS